MTQASVLSTVQTSVLYAHSKAWANLQVDFRTSKKYLAFLIRPILHDRCETKVIGEQTRDGRLTVGIVD